MLTNLAQIVTRIHEEATQATARFANERRRCAEYAVFVARAVEEAGYWPNLSEADQDIEGFIVLAPVFEVNARRPGTVGTHPAPARDITGFRTKDGQGDNASRVVEVKTFGNHFAKLITCADRGYRGHHPSGPAIISSIKLVGLRVRIELD